MKTLAKIVMFLMMSLPVMANDIYVTQSGATLTFDVLQDGQNNTIGNSTTASTVTGATSNFNIDQIGNSNVLTFDINGANYTGTFSTTGNSNDIDIKCDSGGTVSSCATVTASIIWVGSSNDLDIDVGENARLTRPLTSRLAYMAIIDVLAVGVAQLKPEAQDHLFNIVTSQSSLKLK